MTGRVCRHVCTPSDVSQWCALLLTIVNASPAEQRPHLSGVAVQWQPELTRTVTRLSLSIAVTASYMYLRLRTRGYCHCQQPTNNNEEQVCPYPMSSRLKKHQAGNERRADSSPCSQTSWSWPPFKQGSDAFDFTQNHWSVCCHLKHTCPLKQHNKAVLRV